MTQSTPLDLMRARLLFRTQPQCIYICTLLIENSFHSLLRVANPEEFSGNTVSYCVEQFLVHLDDPSIKMQRVAFDALCAMICFNESFTNIIAAKVEEVHLSHRDPALCNQLLRKVMVHRNQVNNI